MLSDITHYFSNREGTKTIQQKIGVDKVFRGMIVENWKHTLKSLHFKLRNKVIVRNVVLFYHKY